MAVNNKQICSLKFVTLYIFLLSCLCLKSHAKPNIVFILTDDQDVTMGGMMPLRKTAKLIGEAGMVFENMFTSSPLCCPSRASIMTGRYTHNHQALNNSISGNCSSTAWQKDSETQAFAVHLKEAGYKTFFAGKYLNQYGTRRAGGVKHIPPGWDEWRGLVGNSRYYNYTLSINGVAEKHGDDYDRDYLTSIVGRHALKFLDEPQREKNPFFMMLSTPSCHAPFTPAPQYHGNFSNFTAPREGSFNVSGKDKHWLVRNAKWPLSKNAVSYIDNTYRNRWRTLLTVDDIVQSVVEKLESKKLLDNTYIFYSSDNGYHLGQFSLPNDKRQLYDFDIRVPLMVRGPGIKSGQVKQSLAVNIDFAPTFLDLAGVIPPNIMDGQSLKPILLSNSNSTLRNDFIVEHYGEYSNKVQGCPQYDNENMANCEIDCVCNDSKNNTYACLRKISDSENLMYCQFSDAEGFVEFYNLTQDVNQMKNLAKTIDPKELLPFNQRLIELAVCLGSECHKKNKYY